MPSKDLLKYIGFFIFLTCVSCDESGDNPLTNSTDVLSREDLIALTDQINFEIKMADGNTVIFSPSQGYSLLEENNFSEMGSWQYNNPEFTVTKYENSQGDLGFIKISNSSGVSLKEATFSYSYCSNYRNLRLNYPQLEISPNFDNYELVIAFSEFDHDVLEFWGGNISEDYLVFLISPSGNFLFGDFILKNKNQYGLKPYSFEREGSTFKGIGTIEDSDLFYEFEVNCD